MSYCGLCDTHDVKLTYSKDGIECSNCGFDYHENLDKDNAERSAMVKSYIPKRRSMRCDYSLTY